RAQQTQHGHVQIADDRANHFDGIILLGHLAEIAEMVGRIVDTADEGTLTVDHHQLAVQATKQVGAHAEAPGARIENVDLYSFSGQGRDVFVLQVGSAVAVHGDDDAYSAPCGFNQHLLQLEADLVFTDDEGFQQHFDARRADAFENPRVVVLAIDQQAQLVAVSPYTAHR